MIAALALGRKGSVGFPRKNVTDVLGMPLAWHTLRQAQLCREIDHLYLSTDDSVLKSMGEEMGGVEIIDRPDALCTKEALAEDAYLHGLKEIEARSKEQVELLICLFCNAPTFTPQQVSAAISVLRNQPELDSAVTVSRYNMYSPSRARRKTEEGLLEPWVPFEVIGDAKKLSCDRDSMGDVFFADVALTVIRPKNLYALDEGLLPQRWMGKKIHPIDNEAGLDIDYEWQRGQLE